MDKTIEKICQYFTGIDATDDRRHYNQPLVITERTLCSSIRRRNVVAARMFVAVHLRNQGWTLNRIAEWMGGRHHSSIIHLVQKYHGSMRTKLRNEVHQWSEDLNFNKKQNFMKDYQIKSVVASYQFFTEKAKEWQHSPAVGMAFQMAADRFEHTCNMLDIEILPLEVTAEMEKEAAL